MAVNHHAVLRQVIALFSRKRLSIQGLMILPMKNSPYKKILLAAVGGSEASREVRDQMAGLAEILEIEPLKNTG
jgi:acetolactate synthase small subunit